MELDVHQEEKANCLGSHKPLTVWFKGLTLPAHSGRLCSTPDRGNATSACGRGWSKIKLYVARTASNLPCQTSTHSDGGDLLAEVATYRIELKNHRPAPLAAAQQVALGGRCAHFVFSASGPAATCFESQPAPGSRGSYFRLRKYTSLLMDSSRTRGPGVPRAPRTS